MHPKEIDFLKNYINLEKIRFKKDRNITFKVEGNYEHLFIPPLLTFTFIENAFKYALKNKNSGFVNINIKVLDNFFYFTIINDKIPVITKEDLHKGIGITNIKKRLELLYPNQHELTIEDREEVFFVSMVLRL